ncbi:MAG: Uncharacterised protein [Cryomorphaceae bacterium]|nr:MAG: Uncharacterised protein [Cryomorphaceae bacterium]
MRKSLYIFIIISLVFQACKKDVEINPYDNPNLNSPKDTTTNYFPDATAFQALHNNIFIPTCANSGCHDGSFEPDFRTIESSYNTLVYQPVIKNDNGNTYEFRVKPSNSDKSILYKRLIEDIDGISGIMPLSAEYNAEHYWFDHKEEYIQNIKDWIDNGAKDMFGNLPLQPNNIPEMRGVIAFVTGQNTPLAREIPRGTIYVPSSANSIDLWFSVQDDILLSNELSYNKIKFSTNLFNFENKPEFPLEVIMLPKNETGFYVSTTDDFYHKYTLDMSTFTTGDIVFIKIYVKDDVNPVTEIPSNGSDYNIVKHFTFTVQ